MSARAARPAKEMVPAVVGPGALDLKQAPRNRPPATDPRRLDRLPPHSPEAEQGALGCVLLAPNDCVAELVKRFRGNREVMYDLRHQTILETCLEMHEAGQAIDVITLQQRLKDKHLLEEVGGIGYLARLPDVVPSAANLTYYLDIVQEKYLLRKLITVCTQVVGRVYDYEGEVPAMLDEVERDILAVRGLDCAAEERPALELVRCSMNAMEAMAQRQGMVSGLATGLMDLDKLTSGQQAGELNVLAGFPTMGKTSLAMNMAEHAAVDLEQPVGVFSLEMTSESLMTRLICSRARVNLRSVQDGFLADRDLPKLTAAAGKLSRAPLHFDDTSDLSIHELRARARRMWQRYSIKLFVVDYLQLMNAAGGSRKVENRQQEVSDIASGLKGMAKEFRVPVLALSQLNDDGALRESRAIGQHADGVWVLQKSKRDKNDEEEGLRAECVPIDLLIRKQRNGPTGVVPLTFLKEYTRFESAAKAVDEEAAE